eukprot:TRINITY_DN21478_c0_g1_i2.p1 TRINITY_DN21478_c0_g1~~TRINITY_DN21478_c0_g1_i2.p1  ORF type:complete len:505 (+),score=53.20 TRINITY_DN21478_c0_g1_i2:122-1636(+)
MRHALVPWPWLLLFSHMVNVAGGTQVEIDGMGAVKTHVASHEAGHTSCSVLKNRKTHYTVELKAGTPAQSFNVVADTGSSYVIIPSCRCDEAGGCNAEDRCFTGTNTSSTFELLRTSTGIAEMGVRFGSGDITVVMATDVVQVGQIRAPMKGSVLLMTENKLRIAGAFEGILGLGMQRRDVAASLADARAPTSRNTGRSHVRRVRKSGHDPTNKVSSFLESSGIHTFSMCLRPNIDGALRFSKSASHKANTLKTVGQFHWALGFQGISVGSAELPVQFCSASSIKEGQKTACAAIPDSGTTLLMGPKEQLVTLFAQICEEWPRCRKAHKQTLSKHHTFLELLNDCSRWVNASSGLSELPTLHFHLAGADGVVKDIELTPDVYVLETTEDKKKYVTQALLGILPVRVAVATGRSETVCMPSFGSFDYDTQLNGPSWILGLPAFFEHQVEYDLHARPPSVAFTREVCSSCSEGLVQLGRRASTRTGAAMRIDRHVRGPVIDTDSPL